MKFSLAAAFTLFSFASAAYIEIKQRDDEITDAPTATTTDSETETTEPASTSSAYCYPPPPLPWYEECVEYIELPMNNTYKAYLTYDNPETLHFYVKSRFGNGYSRFHVEPMSKRESSEVEE